MGDLGINPSEMSSVPTDINLGYPISGTGIQGGVDISQILADLGLSPTQLDFGPPPPEQTISLPPTEEVLPPPPVTLEEPPVIPPLPPPDLTGILAPVGLPPIGYDASGNPIYSVTGGAPAPPSEPPIQGPIAQPPPVTVTTAGGGGAVTVNVVVNNAENIANDVIRQLQEAVTKGISDSVAASAEIAKNIFQQVASVLKTIGETIWNALKTAVQAIASQLGQLFSDVAGALKNAAEAVFKGIGDVLVNLKNVIIDVINKIGPILDNIAKHIQNIDDHLIRPIANIINTTVRTIAALTVAIEKDLHSGLSGILKIPSDIASGIESLDSTMQRTVQQLGGYNADLAHSIFVSPDGSSVAQSMKGLQDTITQGTGFHQIASTFSPKPIALTDETFQQISAQLTASVTPVIKEILGALWNEAKGVLNTYGDTFPTPRDTGSIFDPVEKAAVEVTNKAINLAQSLLSALLTGAIGLAVLGEEVGIAAEYAGERAHKAVPITKLDTASAITAYVRKYITEEALNDELLSKGFDGTRQTVLKDLSVFLAPIDQAVDWWVRGAITDDDLADNLRRNGLLDRDVEVVKETATQIISPGDALLAFRRGVIDEAELDNILKTNRYTRNYTLLSKDLLLRPLTTQETIEDGMRRAAAQREQVFASVNTDAPPPVTEAGIHEGLDYPVSNAAWRAHWNLPSIQAWVSLYFRGVRTRSELDAALDYFGVPPEMHDDIVVSFRPLLPYRSVPSFVRLGLITEARAREILAGHGFELQDINAVLESITKSGKTTKATAAAGIATLSIVNARTLFLDSAIDQSQYEAILEAHGYTPELAKAQAEVDTINAHAKHRKQTLGNYAAEVEAGVLTLDDAIQQLTQQGFTSAEVQTWQSRVLRTLRLGSKRVSVSEMDKYLKAGLITIDQYSQELKNQGWVDPWYTAQIALVSQK